MTIDYAFFDAAYQGDTERMLHSIENGHDVNSLPPSWKSVYQPTALAYAVWGNQPDAVRFLLEHGADPNQPDGDSNYHPLHWASYKSDHAECAQLLVDAGAEPSVTTARGFTPLQLAHGQNSNVSSKPGVAAVLEEAVRNPRPRWRPPGQPETPIPTPPPSHETLPWPGGRAPGSPIGAWSPLEEAAAEAARVRNSPGNSPTSPGAGSSAAAAGTTVDTPALPPSLVERAATAGGAEAEEQRPTETLPAVSAPSAAAASEAKKDDDEADLLGVKLRVILAAASVGVGLLSIVLGAYFIRATAEEAAYAAECAANEAGEEGGTMAMPSSSVHSSTLQRWLLVLLPILLVQLLTLTYPKRVVGYRDAIRSYIRQGRKSMRRVPSIPPQFLCPITNELMQDPVTTCDGHAFERLAIERWLRSHRTSPMTGMPLETTTLTPAIALRQLIEGEMRRSEQ